MVNTIFGGDLGAFCIGGAGVALTSVVDGAVDAVLTAEPVVDGGMPPTSWLGPHPSPLSSPARGRSEAEQTAGHEERANIALATMPGGLCVSGDGAMWVGVFTIAGGVDGEHTASQFLLAMRRASGVHVFTPCQPLENQGFQGGMAVAVPYSYGVGTVRPPYLTDNPYRDTPKSNLVG